MTAPGIPEAWPALLNRAQLLAYLGDLGDATVRMICPVAPVDLGANVLRYRRGEVDAWLESLHHRLPKAQASEQDASRGIRTVDTPAANDPPSAIERARARAAR